MIHQTNGPDACFDMDQQIGGQSSPITCNWNLSIKEFLHAMPNTLTCKLLRGLPVITEARVQPHRTTIFSCFTSTRRLVINQQTYRRRVHLHEPIMNRIFNAVSRLVRFDGILVPLASHELVIDCYWLEKRLLLNHDQQFGCRKRVIAFSRLTIVLAEDPLQKWHWFVGISLWW